MNYKKEFFKKNDAKFLPLGFKKIEDDPMFHYKYDLIEDSVIKENELEEDEVPCLLVGNTGINSGICLSAGDMFIWINAIETIEQAIEWSSRITNFEPK
ncbi:hypothetical protein SAMN05421741_11840 [Paenimyroides ummariense]|uniref:Uncharacterized protein n=1 Tax=Paenimyroides ummariense TaxID=913024 RepID=A0A1I5E1Q0_9FLAO|nr:hypothetical protein [Paenimyroides ummariense]SFO05200.1 hypothetical protein SAMN05421741_11840 [Paenimyroides ummariense]